MSPLSCKILCVLAGIHTIQAVDIWYYPMNETSSDWSIVQGSYSVVNTGCPTGTSLTSCWQLSVPSIISLTTPTSTVGYSNVQFSYQLSTDSQVGGTSQCIIGYILDDINAISLTNANAPNLDESYTENSWNVDDQSSLSIRIRFTSSTGTCYVNEFRLTGDTQSPTTDPTTDPTFDPTTEPTLDPTMDPTMNPTIYPTMQPPSAIPTTSAPTTMPTVDPTTSQPTTSQPTTDSPTTSAPTPQPTMSPQTIMGSNNVSTTAFTSTVYSSTTYIATSLLPTLSPITSDDTEYAHCVDGMIDRAQDWINNDASQLQLLLICGAFALILICFLCCFYVCQCSKTAKLEETLYSFDPQRISVCYLPCFVAILRINVENNFD